MLLASEELEKVEFEPGQYLFNEGDLEKFFYIIQEGFIEVFIEGPAGDEIRLATLEAGQPLGEFAMIVNQPRIANARALTKGFAFKISERGYKALLEDLPEWAFFLIKSLIERLRSTDEMLRQNAFNEEASRKIKA